MKYGLVFLMFLMLVSCKYFDVEKTSSEAILQEELKTFNWDEVDTYPSFSSCDTTMGKEEGKVCFQEVLTQHIMSSFQKEMIVVTRDVHDTLNLDFMVSEVGDLSLSEVKVDSITLLEIPEIKNLIAKSLDSLPKIFPAVKRAQPVKTTFTLPIIIDVE